ncbi:cytochrome P450 family protein [Streptomyces beigongshangae]|uniref:cytochrome P450 family protein n=1 Tax=Streptomyces beigongshangae TaxID=2841597 RepID=UPI001C85388D|nr:cytochrome P450 [Streptomyces sp. REN17]
MATEVDTVDLAALGPDFVRDPHPVYARLRAQRPVHRVRLPDGFTAWLVLGHEEARAALGDPRLSNDWRNAGPQMGAVELPPTPHMLMSDPPRHTRLRRLVAKEFSPRRVRELGPRVHDITHELIDRMLTRADGRADLVEDFAFPLPAAVIGELLGVPAADRDRFRHWSTQVTKGLGGGGAEAAMGELVGYLSELLATLRTDPGHGLLGALVRRQAEDEDALSVEELTGMALLLLIAGHETTTGLIANGMLALLQHRDQLDDLRADMSLLDGAVEEMLRHSGPTGTSLHRFTTEPVEIGGTVIPGGGELVLIGNTPANHDPARFPDPERFDIRRACGGHLAFGHGIHMCFGAPLARLEVATAVRALVERCPGLALDADPAALVWHPSVMMRGLDRLPVRVR